MLDKRVKRGYDGPINAVAPVDDRFIRGDKTRTFWYPYGAYTPESA